MTIDPDGERDDRPCASRTRARSRAGRRPTDLKSASSPLASRKADEEPDDRGEEPGHEPLERGRPGAPGARSRPSSRSVANSRVRWAIVIESVFAITNAPTKSAMPPNASRKYCRNESAEVDLIGALLAPAASPVRTWVCGGRTVWIWRRAAWRRDARLGGDVDLVELALLVEERLRGRQVEDRERRAADRGRVAEVGRCPMIRNGCSVPARGDHADRVADGEGACESPCAASIATSSGAGGPASRDERRAG